MNSAECAPQRTEAMRLSILKLALDGIAIVATQYAPTSDWEDCTATHDPSAIPQTKGINKLIH